MRNCDRNLIEMILTYQKSQPKVKVSINERFKGRMYDIAPINSNYSSKNTPGTTKQRTNNNPYDHTRAINVIEEERNS